MQCFRQLLNHVVGQPSARALDNSDVFSRDASQLGKLLLRPPVRGPQLFKIFPNDLAHISHARKHSMGKGYKPCRIVTLNVDICNIIPYNWPRHPPTPAG